MINNTKRKTKPIVLFLIPGSVIPLAEACVVAQLPLPREIVTPLLSPVAMRAHGVYGRCVGNEVREVWKARKHGELVESEEEW